MKRCLANRTALYLHEISHGRDNSWRAVVHFFSRMNALAKEIVRVNDGWAYMIHIKRLSKHRWLMGEFLGLC